MLNEKRVKHMVKLALFETKSGQEELKASSFYKKDYVAFQVLWSIIWMTIAYVALVTLVGIGFLNDLIETMSKAKLILIGTLILVVYIVLLIIYLFVSRRFYKDKHARAYYRSKEFKADLAQLEVMYEKEDIDGEVV